MKRIALVGYGYWGPNILRNLLDNQNCEVAYCCDKDKERLTLVGKRYPGIIITDNFDQIAKDKSIDAVIIATPTRSHFLLAKKALLSGKDVLIEKPMTLESKKAWELVRLAKKLDRIIMVDHTFLFNEAIIKIKKILNKKEIGDVLYIDAVRTNLGLFQKDSNVIFDLATHDLSIVNYLLEGYPNTIQAHTQTHFGKQEEVAYILAAYPKKISVHIHVSWLSPVKIRRMLIVGTKKMIVYDDVEPTEKIRIYDKGIVVPKLQEEVQEVKIGYRSGDVWLPKVNVIEPLSLLIKEFIYSIKEHQQPKSNGQFGAEIVELLENATQSARKGRKVSL